MTELAQILQNVNGLPFVLLLLAVFIVFDERKSRQSQEAAAQRDKAFTEALESMTRQFTEFLVQERSSRGQQIEALVKQMDAMQMAVASLRQEVHESVVSGHASRRERQQ